MYIPKGIRRELARFGMNCDGKGKFLGLLEENWWPFILVVCLTHLEGITLGAGEEIDEVAGGANGI